MTHDPNKTPSEDDEFFVGYFPSPPKTTRYALAIATAMVLASGAVAAAASYLQRPRIDIARHPARIWPIRQNRNRNAPRPGPEINEPPPLRQRLQR